MDNAAFHKTPKTKSLIESFGCHLLYLPTYSPDLNPIEHCWHTIKSCLRPLMHQCTIIFSCFQPSNTYSYHLGKVHNCTNVVILAHQEGVIPVWDPGILIVSKHTELISIKVARLCGQNFREAI